jgi:hypothetical protein
MKLIILLFGLVIAATGMLMLWKPAAMADFLRRHAGSTHLHQAAIGVRLVLGIVLIGYADQSRFPLLLGILGGLSIAAAVVIAVLPGHKFEQLVRWAIERFEGYMRPASIVVVVFGLILITAVA